MNAATGGSDEIQYFISLLVLCVRRGREKLQTSKESVRKGQPKTRPTKRKNIHPNSIPIRVRPSLSSCGAVSSMEPPMNSRLVLFKDLMSI